MMEGQARVLLDNDEFLVEFLFLVLDIWTENYLFHVETSLLNFNLLFENKIQKQNK